MARQAELVKIGCEGFCIIEECYGRNSKKTTPSPDPVIRRYPGGQTYDAFVIAEASVSEISMARQAELVKIGREGFSIIEECYGRNRKKTTPSPDPVICRYRVGQTNDVFVIEEATNHRHAPIMNITRKQYEPPSIYKV